MERSPLYRLLRPMGRAVVRIFHRKVAVENGERVPRAGGVVVAANHPNMMLDVLLLGATQPRTLHFLAKATLFRNRLLARVLTASGVLPVHRRRDGGGETSRNLDTFAACHELLAEGGAIAIFPEGVSHHRDAVLPLRTGAARIVLEAEAKHDFRLGVVIVPVGLSFSNRELFRSDALVVYGEPIDPSPFFDDYRQGREVRAVQALTGKLESALRALARHVPREDDEVLVRALRQFFASNPLPSAEGLVVDRALVDAVSEFREEKPLEYARLRRQVLGYSRVLEVLGLTHELLDRSYRLLPVLLYVVPRLVLAAVGFVPFLAGAVFHYLPYKIPAVVAAVWSSEPVERATIKLFAGLVVFPLFYLGAAFFTGQIALVALLPLLGLFSLLYLEGARELAREVRVFFLNVRADGRLARLKAWRRELIAELDRHRSEYESARALENQPAE